MVIKSLIFYPAEKWVGGNVLPRVAGRPGLPEASCATVRLEPAI